jgi:hypothetical protein
MRTHLRWALLCCSLVLAASVTFDSAVIRADLPDVCQSTATVNGSGVVVACPLGDGDALAGAGLTITVTVVDALNMPVAGIPPQDFWLIGCNDELVLCGGSNSINADASTDANGVTHISGAIASGGCDTGVRVVVQGVVIGNGACVPVCLPIAVRSPDQVSSSGGQPDGIISAADLAYFALNYQSPPRPYAVCDDYAAPYGTISLADFARLAVHYDHSC